MNLQEKIDKNLAVVEDFLQTHNVPTTYDEAALKWLEDYIFDRRAEWSPDEANTIIMLVGSFLGECVRRTYGGEWIETEDDTVVQVKGIAARPFANVRRVVAGESGKSITSFYRTLPVVIEHQQSQKEKDDSGEGNA